MGAELRRLEKDAGGVRGVLLFDSKVFCLTLELPWLDNQRDISCIPEQVYVCKRIMSPRFGETFEVMNVAGRSNILFHAGNTTEDTSGCILLGSEFGYLGGRKAVLESGKAVKAFMKKLEGAEFFPLHITN